MRPFLLTILFLAIPFAAGAVEAPSGQTIIDGNKVLRGRFVEAHQMNPSQPPMQTMGHFIAAPAYGLIWGIEKPFPTSTIITQHGLVQDIGGMVMKLPTKNLRHLYDMVGGALAGDWRGLETDFDITPSGNAGHWQMLLTPRHDGKAKLPYAAITVSGSRFVENIVLTKADGSNDIFSFSDEVLSAAPPAAHEIAAFNEAGR
jgi:hypothetical protein